MNLNIILIHICYVNNNHIIGLIIFKTENNITIMIDYDNLYLKPCNNKYEIIILFIILFFFFFLIVGSFSLTDHINILKSNIIFFFLYILRYIKILVVE
jgi:hypothetical protein